MAKITKIKTFSEKRKFDWLAVEKMKTKYMIHAPALDKKKIYNSRTKCQLN